MRKPNTIPHIPEPYATGGLLGRIADGQAQKMQHYDSFIQLVAW